MSRPRNPEARRGKFPYFVGFYTTKAQRDKLDRIIEQTHRGLGETMRLLLDHAQIRVRELDFTAPAQITPSNTPEA